MESAVRCPECRGRRYIIGATYEDKWECYLCRACGEITRERYETWALTEGVQIAAQEARIAAAAAEAAASPYRESVQLAFEWLEHADQCAKERRQHLHQ